MVLESCFHPSLKRPHLLCFSTHFNLSQDWMLEAKYTSEAHLTYPYMVACMWSAFL